FTASISDAGTDNVFQRTIPPGVTVFWQTDGSSEELTSGTARIVSDHPIAVVAVITSLDSSGGFVSETGVAPAPPGFEVLLLFDSSRNAATGASFFNEAK